MLIELIDGDKLSRHRWTLWVHADLTDTGALKVVLREWAAERRETPRHKWQKVGEGYKSRPHNGSVHYGGWCLPSIEVPLPSGHVAGRIKAELTKRIELTWARDPAEEKRR
jgi:hypothetical protein